MKNLMIRTQTRRSLLASLPVFALYSAVVLSAPFNEASAQVAPSLGSAQQYAILGGSTVTNTGSTIVTGNLGVSPGTALTGFLPGTILRGIAHLGDAAAAQAQIDTAAAYTALGKQTCGTTYPAATDLGRMILTPGVYCFTSSAQLTGSLTLDAGGDPNAVWIFNVGSTLTTASNSTVALANSAQQARVFWAVGSSSTLGTGSTFQGTLLASASITLNTGAILNGRALAQNGAVTLDDNAASICVCTQPYSALAPSVINTIVVSPATGGVAGTVLGATLSPDGKNVWVAGSQGAASPGFVSLIDVLTQTVTKNVPVGLGPADIAFSAPGGRAFVTNYYDSSLSVVSVTSLKVTQTLDLAGIPMSNPSGLLQASGHIFLTSQSAANQATGNSVWALNTTTPVSVDTAISDPGQSGRPAVVPAIAPHLHGSVLVPVLLSGTGARAGHPTLVVVSAVNATSGLKLTLTSSYATPKAVVVSPDGRYAYVSLSDTSGGSGGVWVVSLVDWTTKTVILTCDPENNGEAISSDGKYLLVAGSSENQVALIDTATDTVDAIISGGNEPNAIALTSDDSEAFFTNEADGTVTVVSFSPSL